MTGRATTPPVLTAGDRVAVVAPSGPVPPSRLDRGVQTLESWGLDVEVLPNVLSRRMPAMFAATDQERALDFENAWCLPSVRAVFCARGGYGAARLIDVVDWVRMGHQEPRWLVGSSDVTSLHESVRRRLGLCTVYGPMVASEIFAGDTRHTDSVEALRAVLFGGVDSLLVRADKPSVVLSGKATGPLVGGNLAVLVSSIGTSDSVAANGSVAFLEDVNEPPYKVDRMLTQLIRSGWFAGAQGVALGTFHGCGDVLPVLVERLTRLEVPILGTFPAGHGPKQLSLPLGAEVTLDTGSGTLAVRDRI